MSAYFWPFRKGVAETAHAQGTDIFSTLLCVCVFVCQEPPNVWAERIYDIKFAGVKSKKQSGRKCSIENGFQRVNTTQKSLCYAWIWENTNSSHIWIPCLCENQKRTFIKEKLKVWLSLCVFSGSYSLVFGDNCIWQQDKYCIIKSPPLLSFFSSPAIKSLLCRSLSVLPCHLRLLRMKEKKISMFMYKQKCNS